MSRRKQGGLVMIGAKVDAELAAAVEAFAVEAELTMSAAIGKLLLAALEDKDVMKGVERDLEDEGYQAGLRRGLHEAREHMKKMYAPREREGGGR